MESNRKTLVVYYSAQGHTKEIATKIANNLDADIFEIELAQAYSEEDLDWTDANSRASRENDDESLRDVELKNVVVPNWDEYETVLIGYPIWWGVSAWPMDSFVKQVDFGNKTVIPFCTSHTSGLGMSDEEINAKFGFLVDAYRYASPPHGGMGIGLDRIAMIMCKADSLRDVTAFPKVQNASELMSECPSPVDKENLDVLGISVKETE